MDRWFSAAACLLALVSAGFALWAASIEIGMVRDSLDHFIVDGHGEQAGEAGAVL
jgi:hypothetical protein